MVLDLADFTKQSVDLTLNLGGSGLKFCEEDLNMAAINFFPLQNLKCPDLDLNLDFGLKLCQKNVKSVVLDLADFTKQSVDLTLCLGCSGLKFCKEDLNMAAINFSLLQNLKWL